VKLEWRPVAPGDGPTISTSLTTNEALALASLAKDAEVLEVGSAYGYSAVVMALAGARVTAVDPHVWLVSHGPMVTNLTSYGVHESVAILLAGAEQALPVLLEQGYKYNLIWIDGDHERYAVDRDVLLSIPLLAPNGVLACHDWDEDTCPGVRQALEARLGYPDELIDTLAIYRGRAL
jgi:predicted O-methyltransferase YrrM